MFTCKSVPFYCAQTLPKRINLDAVTPKRFTVLFSNGSVITASSNYWSSTTNASNPDNAWNVNFNNGNDMERSGIPERSEDHANNKTNSNYVRCARGGA